MKGAMNTITYTIPNISCNHCVMHVTHGLKELSGVTEVKANADTKLVEVTYVAPTTDEEMREKLVEIGYPAN